MKTFFAWGMLALALIGWGGFGLLVYDLYSEREAYARDSLVFEEESLKGESATRLRSVVRDTEAERNALTSVISVPLLDVAEMIEAAGDDAGATNVSIGEATPVAKPPKNLSVYTFVLNANGSFMALMRTVILLESLPIPTNIERFEISKSDKTWRLTARINATIALRK